MKRTRNAFFHSLAVKIGAVIVLAELVISAVTGAFYITNFNAQIDRRISDNVLRPTTLMNQGLLKLEVVTDEKRMYELVGEDLIDAFVIGLNGNIFYSLKHEYIGRSASSVPRIDANLLDPGLTRPLVQPKEPQGHIFALAPLFGADGRSLRFFVYIEASTAVAADQKRNNVWLFVLGSLAIVVLTSIVILIAFNLTIFTPLQHILSALGQMESGNLTIQLATADIPNELGDLARAFNRMTARLRQTLEALHRERDLLEGITETSPVCITVLNRDGQVTFANAQSEKVLGLNKDTITQRAYNAPAWRITDENGAPFPDEALPFRQVMSTNRPVYDVQHAIIWPDGHRIMLSINAAPLLDGAGEVTSVVCTIEDITQRRQMEQERLAHLKFLENMDSINRVIQENKNLEHMLSDVLDVVISVFECDRANLVYPCDAETASWQSVVERTRPEYPGAVAPISEVPTDPGVVKVYQAVLATNDPVAFGTGNDYPLPADVAERFPEQLRLTSQLATAIYPKKDKPYMFVIHQFARPRIWTQEERRLFKEIGRRLEDGLTSLLMYRNLQDSEKRYRMVFENSPVSIWEEDFSAVKTFFDGLKKKGVADIETWFDRHPETVRHCAESARIVDVNQAALALHGAETKQDLLAGLVHTFTPESFGTFRKELVCLWCGGTAMTGDAVVKTLAGEPRYVTVYFTVCPGHEQTYSKVLVSLIDITDRKQAEEKLQESEERLRLTLEAAQIGIFDWDVEHDFWYASPEYYTMLGYEPIDGKGNRREWLKRVHPDDQGHVEARIREVLARTPATNQSQTYEYEARIRHANGAYRWEYVKGFVIRRDQQERVKRLLGIRMDITERRTAEEALRRLNMELDQRILDRTAQLEAANKELEAFAYSVSHDLRAPLRHIDGFLELLEKKVGTALDEQGRHYIDTISEVAKKMGYLIDDLLAFSRMGRKALSFKKVALRTVVRDVIRGLEPDAADRTVDWRIGDLPAVIGDASMLRAVLGNLISNALKFTRPRKQARIEIGSLPGHSTEIVIYVRDNGVGFDMTYADKLFGVFQRLHHADEFEGTGIGLTNVRRIITRHGGRTWAEGKVDQGATFYFALPKDMIIQGIE